MSLKIRQQVVQPFDVVMIERLSGFDNANYLFPGFGTGLMAGGPFGFTGDFVAQVADEIENGKLAMVRSGACESDFCGEGNEKLVCAICVFHN